LSAALRSIEIAAQGLDVETIVIEDSEGRGPSWARNRGLDKAAGDVVFFVDADDTVKKDFFRRPLCVLEQTGADICFFTYRGGPKLDERVIDGAEAVRERFLPAFFGYSMDDVRRWNAGGSLYRHKELGQVWRCAYRRSFLDRHAIRFDEAMTFYEDAAFLSFCTAFAEKAATIPDELYEYIPLPGGNLASGSGSRRHWEYKFLVLESRKRLDAKTEGAVWRYCAASCVFSAMEMMRLWKRAGLSPREAFADLRRYISDRRVKEALWAFPLSRRHPLAAAAVLFLRFLSR
jgi:glycosyltransferase involved in cell wall biosynthesis